MARRKNEPVLNGKIYCSPWCGQDCKKTEYDRAVKKASALAKRLGPGWTTRVWENQGWNYEAIQGLLRVHPPYRGWEDADFTIYLNTTPQILSSHRDPRIAINCAIDELENTIKRLQVQRREVHRV